ncbi:MAG: RtcB family protein [Deltaproteobacteria bacterium]|nr:MAG: RtcB family protein [Deltaproteobacteria bacterium]
MSELQVQRIAPYHLRLPKQRSMQVEADVFASERIPIEKQALAQLADAASVPGVARVLATPDIHVGFGVPIGAVVAAADFVSPAAVGYDINCGMRLLTTPWQAGQVDVEALAREVRNVIPLGEGKTNVTLSRRSLEKVLNEGVGGLLEIIERELGRSGFGWVLDQLDLSAEIRDLQRIERSGSLPGRSSAVPGRALERGAPQLGTLGGGNHFIEFQRVEEIFDEETAGRWGIRTGQLVVMIHSGSRGLGHEIGGHFMRLAADYDKKHGISVPNRQLAILPMRSRLASDYMDAMNAAANYAFANRHVMAMLIKAVIRKRHGPVGIELLYDVAHNLASTEEHDLGMVVVHRKGATRAFPSERMKGGPFSETGQPVLIPGSMGTSSWLLKGTRSGGLALFSTNHGAGRVMSRKQARGSKGRKAAVGDAEFERSMRGIFLICENRRTIKEEAPIAYKDIDEVISCVHGAGLAQPVARMKPLAVLKG